MLQPVVLAGLRAIGIVAAVPLARQLTLGALRMNWFSATENFEVYFLVSAGLPAKVYDCLVPVFGVVDERHGVVVCAVDVVCHLVCYVFDCFFVEGHGGFVL